jgi:hypothetical protein
MPAKVRSIDKSLKVAFVPTKDNNATRKLAPNKQKILQEILDREAIKAKAEKLMIVLKKKLVLKYGR